MKEFQFGSVDTDLTSIKGWHRINLGLIRIAQGGYGYHGIDKDGWVQQKIFQDRYGGLYHISVITKLDPELCPALPLLVGTLVGYSNIHKIVFLEHVQLWLT